MTLEVGLVSDTHGFLDPQVRLAFKDVDEIWHAGDFGDLTIGRELEGFKPFRGVYGNIDDSDIRYVYPESMRFLIEGVDVWMIHIAGNPRRYDRNVVKILKTNPPDVLVCGHTHICHVERDSKYNEMLYLNPGAAGHKGFHQMRTLLKFRIAGGKVSAIRVVELGPRGRKELAKENEAEGI